MLLISNIKLRFFKDDVFLRLITGSQTASKLPYFYRFFNSVSVFAWFVNINASRWEFHMYPLHNFTNNMEFY